MNIEFHYHITWLIAAWAGLPPEDTRILATASQYTDDNDIIFEIDKDKPSAYGNYISQTMNILKPKARLIRIYPIFHFIPGDPMAESTWRADGRMHWLNTTPDSENANRIIDTALETGNLYRIGIACHGYADTWAHQNFAGYFDPFNSMTGPLSAAIPNIGHAEAGHNPDEVALIWKDTRLIEKRVDNRKRFLEAAAHILRKLAKFTDPGITEKELKKRETALKKDLNKCIGEQDQTNQYAEERITRYSKLATKPQYGETEIIPYDEYSWFEEAVNEKVRGLRDRSDFTLTRWDPLTDIYTWENSETYKETHWHRFQQAAKQHQDETWQILKEKNLKGLELPEM